MRGLALWRAWTALAALAVTLAAQSACDAPPADLAPRAECAPRGPLVGWFADRTAQSGADFTYTPIDFRGGPVAVEDLDGDGLLDIVAGSRDGHLAAFRNRGRLHFADATEAFGLPRSVDVSYVAPADLDGDGDVDLVIAGSQNAGLYRNQGGGRFALAGVLADAGSAEEVLPIDLDGDGLLDLYFANWNRTDPSLARNRLYHGHGDLTFDEVTGAAGADTAGLSWTASAFDHDGDGDLDLYVANDTFAADFGGGDTELADPERAPDCFYVHDQQAGATGAPAFADHAASLGLDEPRSSMAGLWGDLDGDDQVELFITDLGQNDAYRLRGGRFTEAVTELGLGQAYRDDVGCVVGGHDLGCLLMSWGAALDDFDLDGRDDLVVADGAPIAPYPDPPPPLVYRGSDSGLEEVSAGLPCFEAHGLVAADLDRDGDLDLVMSTHEGPLRLMENLSQGGGNWLEVALHGVKSGREGRGAVITVVRDDGLRIPRPLGAGGVVHSALPAEVHVGLGDHTATELDVTWPAGEVQKVPLLGAVNQRVVVTEPDGL